MERVAGIVLAAGTSSRLGQPKQLLRYQGRTLVRHVTEVGLAAGLEPLHVVVGAHAAAVEAELRGLPIEILRNERYRDGQGTTVALGAQSLPADVGAAVLLLVDMPAVDAGVIRALVDAWRAEHAPIVRPAYEGQPGNPVLFAGRPLAELAAVEGDEGGRPVLRRHAAEVLLVPTTRPGVLFDVDTWEQYETLLAAPPADGMDASTTAEVNR